MVISDVIRIVLTIFLLIGVYYETGIWTTLCLLFITIGVEGSTLILKDIKSELDKLLDRLSKEKS